MKESAGRKLRVLMLVENPFPQDVRVRREAVALVEAGYTVSVIALGYPGQPRREMVEGVSVYRVPLLTLFDKILPTNSRWLRWLGFLKSWIGYFLEYVYFTMACLLISIRVAFKEGFDVIHAHNPPDTLFVLAWFYAIFGKKFVFDHHDVSPELYLSRFNIKREDGGLMYKALLAMEILSIRASSVTIATNESYKAIQVERGKIDPDRVFVVRNGPDLNRVRAVPPDERLRGMGKTILAYVGVMNPQDGLDYMLRAMWHLVHTVGRKDFYCVAIGGGDSLEDLKNMVVQLDLQDYVWFTGVVSEEDLLKYLSSADICLDPNPSSPLNDVSTWIKVMEYMALAKPIVSFDLKETRFSAGDAAVYVRPNDELEFAKSVRDLMDRPDLRKEMGEKGRQRVVASLEWNIVKKSLLDAYDLLSAKSRRAVSRVS